MIMTSSRRPLQHSERAENEWAHSRCDDSIAANRFPFDIRVGPGEMTARCLSPKKLLYVAQLSSICFMYRQ